MARRQRLLRFSIAIALVFFAASIAARLRHVKPPPPDPVVPQARLNPIEARLVDLINEARSAGGAGRLVLSDRLTIAARAHSDDMAAHGYLAHDSADGDTPADRVRAAGLDYDEIAENLSSDPGHDRDLLPQRTLTAWLASPASRLNLLAPRFRTTAVAISQATDGSYYVTLDLMR